MTLEEAERSKYERMYAMPEYRQRSPGERKAPYAWDKMGMKPGEGLTDFGCGLGRAAKWFQDRGMEVLAVDFAANAIENPVPFVNACLWDLPELPVHDWGYCCDVMEHIPEEKVEDVLSGIDKYTTRGAFFSISTARDTCGSLIGEELHVTVKPLNWWKDRLSAHWAVFAGRGEHHNDLTLLCTKNT